MASVAWMQFYIIGPAKDLAAQRLKALLQRLRRDRVPWPAGKDNISNDSASVQPQANTAGCVPWHVRYANPTATHLHICAAGEGKIGSQPKGLGIGGVNAHRDPKGGPHLLQGTNVVWMTMRQQDSADMRRVHCHEDSLSIGARIHDSCLARHWTAQQIAIHRPRANLNSLQFDRHRSCPPQDGDLERSDHSIPQSGRNAKSQTEHFTLVIVQVPERQFFDNTTILGYTIARNWPGGL
jgi:hypothetical protein